MKKIIFLVLGVCFVGSTFAAQKDNFHKMRASLLSDVSGPTAPSSADMMRELLDSFDLVIAEAPQHMSSTGVQSLQALYDNEPAAAIADARALDAVMQNACADFESGAPVVSVYETVLAARRVQFQSLSARFDSFLDGLSAPDRASLESGFLAFVDPDPLNANSSAAFYESSLTLAAEFPKRAAEMLQKECQKTSRLRGLGFSYMRALREEIAPGVWSQGSSGVVRVEQ